MPCTWVCVRGKMLGRLLQALHHLHAHRADDSSTDCQLAVPRQHCPNHSYETAKSAVTFHTTTTGK